MIEVFVVQRSRLMAEIFSTVLREVEDIRVCGTATSANDAIHKLQCTKCDVALVNANLPDDGALHITKALRSSRSIKVLVVEINSLEQVLLKFIEAGVAGYVLKEESLSDLIKNIRAVYRNEALISPEVAGLLISRVTELADMQKLTRPDLIEYTKLTRRESEVLDLLGEGFSNQDIADRLIIELGTVKNHVHSILQKLQVDNRDEAAQYQQLMGSVPDGTIDGSLE
jgi:two-component system nitrate/nitrite response regulator NarL